MKGLDRFKEKKIAINNKYRNIKYFLIFTHVRVLIFQNEVF